MKSATVLDSSTETLDQRSELRDVELYRMHHATPIHAPEDLERVLDSMSREDLEDVVQEVFRGLYQEYDPEMNVEIINPEKKVNLIGFRSSMQAVISRIGLVPDPY